MFRSGIGLSCPRPVIGTSSSVSTESMSSSKYCTPTKYWFLGKNQLEGSCALSQFFGGQEAP